MVRRSLLPVIGLPLLFLVSCLPPSRGKVDPTEVEQHPVETPTEQTPWDGVLLENGLFRDDVTGWDVPYGRIEHSPDIYFSEPGGGMATTSDTGGSRGFRSSFGQCVDLRKWIAYSEEHDLGSSLVLQAAFMSGPKITEITLHGLFLDDTRCGTGHLGGFDTVQLGNIPDWIEVKRVVEVPESARSIHVFINALGEDETASLYVDDLILYSPDFK